MYYWFTMSKDYAILASGCFWCTETIFDNVNGVLSVVPGYIGGSTENPTYEQVCSGTTGHAEAVKIEYDSNIISFDELLEVFFKTHDPTTLNRQGNDIGSHYRSIILFNNSKEEQIINSRIEDYNKKYFDNKIVTEVKEFSKFLETVVQPCLFEILEDLE